MAAITVAGELRHGVQRIRDVTAQASVGQTDWYRVPQWARYMRVIWNLTAVAGNTPIQTPTLLAAFGPYDAMTDAPILQLGGTIMTSGFTAAGTAAVDVGPGVSGIANDVALGTTGVTYGSINTILPYVIGFATLNDRTSGDETYSYTIDVELRR